MLFIRNNIIYWDTEILNVKEWEKMTQISPSHKKTGVISYRCTY